MPILLLSILLILCILLIVSAPLFTARSNIQAQETAQLGPTIVGGEDAAPGEFPWQAMLIDKNGHFACGGTLIQSTWVLTAAHCLQHGRVTAVVLGAYNRTMSQEPGRQTIAAIKLISHHAYNPVTLEHDIGLIQLSRPITATTTVRPLPLLGRDEERAMATGATATVTGWGTIAEHSILATVLQKVTVPIVDQNVCQLAYGDELRDSMFCAGLVRGGKDSCQGDSGGPLLVYHDSQSGGVQPGWALAGIVSWGNGCARPGYYGVYTNVLPYHTWLLRQIGPALLEPPQLDEQPIIQPTATPFNHDTESEAGEIVLVPELDEEANEPELDEEEANEEETPEEENHSEAEDQDDDHADDDDADDADADDNADADDAADDADSEIGEEDEIQIAEPQPDGTTESNLQLQRLYYLPMIQN